MLNANMDDPNSLVALFDANQLAHDQIMLAMAKAGYLVTSWPMAVEPMPDGNWVEHHATEHAMLAQTLGLQDPGGLSSFSDDSDGKTLSQMTPDEFAQWASLHAQHHDLIASALGLT